MDKQKYISLFEKNLDAAIAFWLDNSPDTANGGILHCLDREGNIFSTDKGVWMQGRAGWTFSYLYNNYARRDEFLTLAKSCIDFAREHCIDTDGRMFVKVARDGSPVEKTSDWFSEAFYVMANAEYYHATGDGKYLAEARKYYDLITEIHRNPSADPYRVSASGSGKLRTMRHFNRPMILLNVGSVMAYSDPERISIYNENAIALAREIAEFYKPEHHATLEAICPDGSILLDSATERVCCPGHDMECAWFLFEEGKRLDRPELCTLAQSIFDDAYEMGADEDHGGFMYFKDILGAPVEAYEQDIKVWWVHNEAIIASLMLYLETADDAYRAIFEDAVEYSFSRFVDTDGEWYATLRRDGTPKETYIKGFIYKGPFHTLRMYVKCLNMLK